TGDAKEKALADLQAVENPDSPVRIIISVGMLKEGWDVKSVYVIASMRASVSEVMTEQTLGRGMRLPFSKYTDVEILDTLEILAHEKYSELLEKRKVLNEAFIDYATYAEVRRLADGSSVVRQKTVESDGEVIGLPGGGLPQAGDTSRPEGDNISQSGASATGQGLASGVTPGVPAPAALDGRGVVDVETRTREAAEAAKKTSTVVHYDPLPDREPILIPKLISVPQFVQVSLNEIVDYGPFERLGRTLTADYSDELKRDRKSTRLNSSHVKISYAVFGWKKTTVAWPPID